jgi:hypothetical protein
MVDWQYWAASALVMQIPSPVVPFRVLWHHVPAGHPVLLGLQTCPKATIGLLTTHAVFSDSMLQLPGLVAVLHEHAL